MPLVLYLALLLFPRPAKAWDTAPHQQITKAALDALPGHPLAAETESLVRIYCMYPDRYLEMEQYGFVRHSPGPQSTGEIRAYCVRPDGVTVHGVSGDRDADIASLIFLFERILSSLSEKRTAEAAKYAGVLSHFIADSLSPPHADLSVGVPVHGAIERSLPAFVLTGSRARLDTNLLDFAGAILDRCYAGAAQNRSDLPAMIKALAARDEATLDRYRLRAGRLAAGILADAYNALFQVAATGR